MSERAAPRARTALSELYEKITGEEDARACRDIPDEACRVMPGNFFVHWIASTATKIGDELASARLVLPWLLTALGAPAFLSGLLVPIRESGALLPQLVVAGYMRSMAIRKWLWVGGSVVQGLCVLAMAGVTATLEGARAGWWIVGLLTVFALGRGVCSVASKDVLGKTIAKARRGTVMGYAAAAAGVVTVALGVYVRFLQNDPQATALFVVMLVIGALLWLLAAAVFALLREFPGATEGGVNAGAEAIRSLGLLRSDRRFRQFVITRTLLLSTALSLPFYAVLARQNTEGGVASLALMIIASGLAGSISAAFWGRLADRSSRLALVLAAVVAAAPAFVLYGVSVADTALLHSDYFYAAVFFILGAAHAGVRLGRKTYLVDMAGADNRATYVALSNTLIGLFLLVGAVFGVIAEWIGVPAVVLLLSVVALAGAASAWRMPEVE